MVRGPTRREAEGWLVAVAEVEDHPDPGGVIHGDVREECLELVSRRRETCYQRSPLRAEVLEEGLLSRRLRDPRKTSGAAAGDLAYRCANCWCRFHLTGSRRTRGSPCGTGGRHDDLPSAVPMTTAVEGARPTAPRISRSGPPGRAGHWAT